MPHPLYRIMALLLALSVLASGCIRQKQVLILRNTKPDAAINHIEIDPTTGQPVEFSITSYKLQPNDNVYIKLNSFEDNTQGFFNSESEGRGGNININQTAIYMTSYSIANDGFLELPLIGKVKAAGKTTAELKAYLDNALKPYFKFPFTTVKLANFKITMLGEVQRPGVHYIFDDKITLYQAIGIAGDFTDWANRDYVRLVRDTETGTEVVYFNLQNPGEAASKYFYLRPNDVVYVEPLKAKVVEINGRTASLVLSAVSLAILITNVVVSSINNSNNP